MTFSTPPGRSASACRGRGRRSTTASCAGAVGAVRRRRGSRRRRSTASRRRAGRRHRRAHRPRRPPRAAGRRRARLAARARPTPHHQPPDAPLSRGLEVHPHARPRPERTTRRSTSGSSATSSAAATAGACRPAPRRASASAPTSRADHVKAADASPSRSASDADAVRYQGNWFPHRLRAAVEDGVFFAGDSAGHCFPLSGEGIRTAFYFGIAARPRDRGGGRGRAEPRARRCARYAAFHAAPRVPRSGGALALQRLVPALPPRALTVALRALAAQPLVRPRVRVVPGPGAPRLRARLLTQSRARGDRLRRAGPRPGRRAGLAHGRGAHPRLRQRRGRGAHARDRPAAPVEPLAPGAVAQGRDVRQRPDRARRCASTATATRCSRSSSPPARRATPARARASTTATPSRPRRTRRCPRSSARWPTRKRDRPSGSYTVELLDDPPRIGAKVEEEAEEVARAAREETDDRVDEEAADVLYHLTVLLHSRDRTLTDAEEVLNGRRR